MYVISNSMSITKKRRLGVSGVLRPSGGVRGRVAARYSRGRARSNSVEVADFTDFSLKRQVGLQGLGYD